MMNFASNGFNCFQNGGWMMGGMFLFWVVVLGVGVLLFFKHVQNNNVNIAAAGNNRADHSLKILNERLAKGEISAEEHEKLRDTLMRDL